MIHFKHNNKDYKIKQCGLRGKEFMLLVVDKKTGAFVQIGHYPDLDKAYAAALEDNS